jgi:hypothetical protein
MDRLGVSEMNSNADDSNGQQALDAAPVDGEEFDVFESMLSDLQPVFDIAKDLSGPEAATLLRKAFELFEQNIRQQQRAFVKFAVDNGWIGLERHITDEIVTLLLDVIAESGIDAANARVPQLFTFERIEKAVNGWGNIPYFEKRSDICSDLFAAYKLGLHSVVIPALLPLAEGLAAEIVRGDSKGTKVISQAVALNARNPDQHLEEFAEAIVSIVGKIYYASTDFGQPVQPGWFNRHRILHGRSADYPTPSNSIRAFLLVDTLAGIWQRANRLGAEAACV